MQKLLNRIFIIILSLWFVVYGTSPLIVKAAGSITLSPATGIPGSTVTVTATGFTANETVAITYDTTTTLASGISSASGNWSSPVTIPASAAGSHFIVATGSASGASANTTFTVTPSISANPASGVTGSSVTVSGAGFGASETGISVTYDGAQVVSSISASVQGSWSSSFIVPASASGARTITAAGASNTANTIFSVTPKISSNLATTAPGSSVTITGTGFGASETGIAVTYNGQPITTVPPSISANIKGGWTATFVVPASPSGSHTIDAYGSSTSVNSVPDINFTTSAGISASRPSAAPGTSVTITGSGFNAGETGITVTYDGNPVASVTSADSTGGWKATFAVPTSPAGSHTIDAGSPTTLATTIANITFTVTPGISASRASAPPGSSITITGSGFGTTETGIAVTYDGTATTSGISADASGGWKASLLVPASPSGSHTLGATGSSSVSVPGITFTVTSSISINPPNAVPKSSVTISGSGFGASETGITVTYDGQSIRTVPASPSADSNGSWKATFTVPDSAAGSHSISAQGSVTPLTSLSDKGVNIEAGMLINPASSYVGATVEVSGSGFAANSPIKFTYDNKDMPASGTTTDASGSFSKSITIPQSPKGDHTIKVTDEQNNNKSATFTMESTPPPTPNPLSPGDGARLGILGDITPTLKWSGVTDPSSVLYNLQVDTDPDFSHPILDEKDIPGKSYILTSSESLPLGSYYWRVRAIDGASNESPWSQVWLLKSGLMTVSALVTILVLIVGLAGGAVYFFMLRRRPRRGWEGVPAPEAEAPKPIPAQWRLIEPGETAGEHPLPYRLALPQPAKGEKVLSTEDMARLKVIVDFAQSLPLVEPGYTSKWLVDLAQTSLGIDASIAVYKQLLDNELQISYEPAWMRHPIFQDLATLLEGQPILQDLNAFVDAVNRCAAEATLLLQQISGEAIAEIPADFLEKGGWEFISAVYADAIRWFLGKSLHDPSERNYALKRDGGEESGLVSLWGEETTAFAECLMHAIDEQEALQFRDLHLKLRRTYRSSDTVKRLVDMMTQMAVQRDRLSSAFSQFDNFTR
ncbi:MAG: IPT/TIG domain-containing protein [Chloroflexota bacterium]